MSVIGSILIWLLIVLGGLLLVLLLVPFQLLAEGAFIDARASGQVLGTWGWGFLAVNLSSVEGAAVRLFGLPVYRFSGGLAKKEKEEEPEKPRKRRSKRGIRWAWRNRWFFLRLARALHLRGGLWGTVGTGDPADTAQLSEQLIRPLQHRLSGFELAIEPDYLDETLELQGLVRSVIWPVEFVGILLATLMRRRNRRALLA